MDKKRVLFVTQEITPFMKESHMGFISRHLPQGIQDKKREVRTFMPRYGTINERRNQLHEVIRLSGLNLVIDDADHSLIIKVASIQQARLQIYFIDNEDYFHRKATFRDKNNTFFEDNDERAIFYARGVLETVKRLGWSPDVIHTHGWISALTPVFVRRVYHENPMLMDAKIVISLYDDEFSENFNSNFAKKLRGEKIPTKYIQHLKKPNYVNLMKTSIDYSDGIIIGSKNVNQELLDYAEASKKPILPYQPEDDFVDAYDEFYESIATN